ncbi:CxC2 domain-containing protein [Mycena kentingensis (nom. inval.)]|nr:CxC2 domain-containing protein [Mycena kentingensis (nom. inval.)]
MNRSRKKNTTTRTFTRLPVQTDTSTGSVSVLQQYSDAAGSSVRTSASIRQVPSLASQPTQGDELVDTAVPSATVPGQEHIAYELDLAEYARELRESDDPLATWAHDDREAYLAELLRFEGRGAHQYLLCRECGSEPAVFRCRDCLDGGILRCRACFVEAHKYLPFHRPQEWNGSYFAPRSLKSLGLRVQLGHSHEANHACVAPASAPGDDFVVVDVNGVHEIGLDFCGCFSSGTRTEQLLRAGLFPATSINARTAATFVVLRHWHLTFLEAKSSVYDYFYSLARQTDNTGLAGLRDRYDEFLRMAKEWRNLQMLKRAGRGHDPEGIAATKPGDCAVLCAACPQPGKNLPQDWLNFPAEKRFLFALFLAIDANFHLKRKAVSSEAKDPGLGDGFSFYEPTAAYMEHVRKHWNMRQARPLSVGDLQLGERYINMDYLFFRSINGSDLVQFFVSYDIACQWHINLWERMNAYENTLLTIDNGSKYFVFLVPKFHLPAHIEACNIRFSFNLTRFVGMTDGEAPERGWSVTNSLAGSTMNMGPGSRRDALNDFFNDQNHKKTIILGQTMLRKVKETAPLVIETQQALLDLEGGFLPETIKAWTDMAVAWEAAASERPASQRQLAEEAAEREQAGTETVGAVRNGMHVTELIAGGLQLEEQQRSLNADTAALGAHATDRQRTALVERSTKLRRKIGAWMEMQLQFFPDVERLRLEDDQARARVAASQSQAVPGVRAGDMQLWLPSVIYPRAVGSHTRLGCTDEILTFEFQMRVGEANEALSTVRRLLLLRSHLYSQKDRNVSGVRANTRSNTRIKVLEERIRRAVAQYQAAWRALRLLGNALNRVDWEVDLRELKADDVRGIPRTHFADPARQRGARSAAPSIDHGAEGLDAAPSQSKRARGTGATNSGLSWIWKHRLKVRMPTHCAKQRYSAPLRDSFEREWEKLPAFIADARRRAGLLLFQQQDDGGGAGEEAQLHDADAPVPLGPPGAVFLPAAD